MDALSIRGLRKSFGGLQVIAGLDLSVAKGERRGIIGPNGAGKTTLFNLVTGWLRPDGGTILIDGRSIESGCPERIARQGLSRSFQKNLLLDGLTVFENLRIACQALHPSRWSVLRSCGRVGEVHAAAIAVAERMQLGEVLGRTVKELSYGQKRQLEVALALCAKPRILLMDEPAAGTSAAERAQLLRLLRALPDELTVILIDHDMDVVFEVCERLTVMDYGCVLADGSPAEVRANPEVKRAYLGARDA